MESSLDTNIDRIDIDEYYNRSYIDDKLCPDIKKMRYNWSKKVAYFPVFS